MSHIYQPVMIKALLGRNGRCTTRQIAAEILSGDASQLEYYERITREIDWLQKSERPRITREVAFAASLGDRSENAEYIYGKKQLREIDRRIRYLQKRLPDLHVVAQLPSDRNRVFFGAWVSLEDTYAFLEHFKPMPMVTTGIVLDGIPGVTVTLLFGGVVFYSIAQAKRREIFLRRIPGLDAVDEAIGGSTTFGITGIMEHLRNLGVADDTIVFFIGDNGHGVPNGKVWLWDQGPHVPLLVRIPQKWAHLAPDTKPGTVVTTVVSRWDAASNAWKVVKIPKRRRD